MGVIRSAILWAADDRWLREHLPRYRFVRRSVARFMPGETLEDALAADRRPGAADRDGELFPIPLRPPESCVGVGGSQTRVGPSGRARGDYEW